MGALKYWIWMTNAGKVPGSYGFSVLEQFGSPEAAYAADDKAYDRLQDVPEWMKERLRNKSLTRAEEILEDCKRLGIRILTLRDTEYPERLRQIGDPPCVLYVKGQLPQIDDELTISVVGARKATPYGEATARRFAAELARQGAVVVSGVAQGVDSAALNGAMLGGGQVISVLGNGIDIPYPKSSESLYEDIPKTGVLLSEYPPGTLPDGIHFPVRNRIISGLSLGVLVVEGHDRSGSPITARRALEQNRDVFAVPGNWNASMSRGPNLLIQRSEAKLTMDAWDILEEYQYIYPHKIHPRMPLMQQKEKHGVESNGQTAKEEEQNDAANVGQKVLDLSKNREEITDDQKEVLLALQGRILTTDDLVERTGISARRVLSALTMLQMKQLVLEKAGKRFGTNVLLKGYGNGDMDDVSGSFQQ